MAQTQIIVSVGCRMVRVKEPSGEPCFVCGDACLLEEYRYRVEVDGKDGGFLPKVRLCQSCAEIARKQ